MWQWIFQPVARRPLTKIRQGAKRCCGDASVKRRYRVGMDAGVFLGFGAGADLVPEARERFTIFQHLGLRVIAWASAGTSRQVGPITGSHARIEMTKNG